MSELYDAFTGSMTSISRSMFDQATMPTLSLTEAVSFLRDNARIRTLRDVLLRFSPEEDEAALKKLLVRGLSAHHPESSLESTQRRVRDWMSTAGRTVDKATAIELAFILQLPLEKADELVAMLTEEGFHWRDPAELAYIFALSRGMSYAEAAALHQEIASTISALPAAAPDESAMTGLIRSQISALTTREDLLAYVRSSRDKLGALHQTAYHMFTRMMSLLSAPTPDEAAWDEGEMDDSRMSVREILQVYMHRDEVPLPSRADKKLTPAHRAILRNWPTEKELSLMKSRSMDVSRKTLMLLFLATDGDPLRPEMDEDEYDEDLWLDEEDEEDDQARFESTCIRLNRMLSQCGMRLLDPRIPFDWMILYCLCGSDSLETDAQIQSFLQALYGDAA